MMANKVCANCAAIENYLNVRGNTGAMKSGRICLENLMKAPVFRRSRSHCIAVNRQLCSRLKSSIYLTARRIHGVSVPQDS